MPHLLIERQRLNIFTCSVPKRKDSPIGAIIIEVLDVIAAAIFVFGSVCFLPRYARDLDIFLDGCLLFIAGSVLYCVVCSFTLAEAIMEKGHTSLEAFENWLYLAGSITFLVGTVLYWPDRLHSEDARPVELSLFAVCSSFGQHVNLYTREFTGSVLFIIGSFLFACAAFTNALNRRQLNEWSSVVLSAVTSLYMGGSILFTMGSVAFLPDLGCNDDMVALGAGCFIAGSVLFLIGSVLSLWRTAHLLSHRTEDVEQLTVVKIP